VGANRHPGQSSLKISHAKRTTASRNFPLASSLLNLDVVVFKEVPKDNTKQTTSPGTQLLPLLLYLISLVHPSSSHPDLLLTNPNDPTCPPTKFPYKKVGVIITCSISSARTTLARSSLLHPTSLRFCPRALPLLSLSLLPLSHSLATTSASFKPQHLPSS
jgi:hypothetical protein